MISVKELTDIILNNQFETTIIEVPFDQSVGYTIAEDVLADRDFPPFDRVAMDGIAINYHNFENGQKTYNVEKIIAAGDPIYQVNDSNACVEIMTGAAMPVGLDTIIRYEDVNVEDRVATINVDSIRSKQNIHFKAMDNQSGALMIAKDSVIKSVDLSILATVGKSYIKVYKPIKTAIVSSGDELVEINEKPALYQIRKSNVYVIQAMIRPYHVHADLFHIQDEKDDIRSTMKSLLEEYDAIIMIGGVSKGKFDFIPDVLTELGVEKLAYRVSQRPGKPFWLGKKEDVMIFALPGNPVSSMVCTRRYFIPWLRSALHLPVLNPVYATLEESFNFKPNLTRFLEVSLTSKKDGKMKAVPQIGNGSGDFTTLNRSQGFMELPQEQSQFKKGEVFPVYLF